MLFQQFVKTLEISVMMIHSEPGKFKNYRLPFKTYAKPRNYTFWGRNSNKI